MKKRDTRKITAGVLAAAMAFQSSAITAMPSIAEDTDKAVKTTSELPVNMTVEDADAAKSTTTTPATTTAPAATKAPAATTAAAATKAPAATTAAAATKAPAATTAAAATKAPAATTAAAATKAPAATTAAAATKAPAATTAAAATKAPAATTAAAATTKAPAATTAAPVTTKEAATTEEPVATTEAPVTTTEAPATTTAAETTTEAVTTTTEPTTTEPVEDTITLTGGAMVPGTLEKGGYVIVKGTITSADSDLVSIEVGIFDSQGNSKYIGTALPGSKTYDLNRMDKYITFDKLDPGKYTYRVTASNGTYTGVVLTEQSFTVVDGQTANDSLTVTGVSSIPAELKKGGAVVVKGTISSASSDITYVGAGIYDSEGKQFCFCEAEPGAKTFNLNTLDEKLTFHKLEAGTYTFRVVVSNAANEKQTVIDQSFRVVAESEIEDSITLTNGTEVPDTLKQGTPVLVKGIVTSAVSELTTLTVGIYDANGGLKTGKTIEPKAASYDLSGLDSLISFDLLTPGSYTYRVIASNATNVNVTLVTKTFTVTAAESEPNNPDNPDNPDQPDPPAEDTLTISGSCVVPTELIQGRIVNVKGVVSSTSSNISSLTVGVYNTEGKMLTGKTVSPKAKSYDLKKLDYAVAFDTLKAGSYTYAVTATNAANTNITLVDQKFTVSTAAASTTDVLTISGANTIPDTIKEGAYLTISGTVTSANSNITALTAGVYDMNGTFVTGKTINPAAKTYNLRNLDNYVQFNKLPAGKYIYAVIASNAGNTNYTLVNKTFTVGSGGTAIPAENDKLTITGGTNIPDTIAPGKALSVTGTVTSATSNITALTVGVYDANGKFVTGKTINPAAKSYDLSKLDSYVEFNKLTAGKYVYAVIATNSGNNNFTLVSKQFTVGDGGTANPGGTTPTDPPADDKLTISGGTTIPDTLAVGKALTIRGTVSSASSNITSLTAGVYDANGKLVTGKTVTPNAKTYDLKNVDNFIEFNKLTSGTYTYKVTATNAASSNFTVVSKSFTVGNGGTTTPSADDKLTISGGTNIPDSIAVGKALTVTGTVNSASSNITSLTVGVYDANGKFVTGKTINPGAKTYDLRKLDSYVEFNKLPAGTYTYAVIASNAANSNFSLVTKQFTVGNGGTTTPSTDDKLSISGGTNIPDSIAAGKALTVTGIVTSASSNITSLTVGVYDASGKFVTGRTINPGAKTYDLKKLDSYVEFNKLPAGTYTYAVIASNAANTNFTLVSKQFKVGSGTGTSAPSTNDALTITGGTSVPDTITQGKALSVKGVVKSASSTITALTVGVYSASGTFVTGKTINPAAKSYDLSKLDNYVEFNKLSAGQYVYAVIATNAGNTNYSLVTKTFTVTGSSGGSSTTNDAITISGGTTVPGTLAKGKGVIVRGTVTSASSNITSLSVGVYDASGKQVTGTTVKPGARTYDLNKADSQVRFDQLAAGTYYYKVIATNSANTGYTVVNQSFTVR